MIRLAVGICFPHIGKWIAETPDPRREHPSRKYELSLMIWTAMVMFVSQPGTRRQYDLDKGTTAFLLNVLALAGLPPDSASRRTRPAVCRRRRPLTMCFRNWMRTCSLNSGRAHEVGVATSARHPL